MVKFATAEEAVAYALKGSIQQPLGKNFTIQKSFIRADGSLGVEGWISTPAQDLDKDIIEPEAFSGATLHDYMLRGAPISVEHNTKVLPVGFLQKARLVRDGRILQDEDNPNHPKEDFRHYAGGTGWYGLGTIYDKNAAIGVMKGVVSSFSWIGMPQDWEPLPDGGKHFKKASSINPVLEVTVTAYPVNTSATMRIAKARGYTPRLDRQKMAELLANPLVVEAVVDILVPPGTASAVIEEQLRQHRFRVHNSEKH